MLWANITHYYHQDENGEITDRIWVAKDYWRAKNFFNLRKGMMEDKIKREKGIVKARFEKRNYIHIATENIGFFTLSLTKQLYQ